MQFKGFLLLILLTAAAVGGVYTLGLFSSDEASATSTTSLDEGTFLPAVRARANDLSEIAITHGGEEPSTLTLRREGDRWGVVERGGYPAELSKIKSLVFSLAQLEVQEPKTAKPENHAELGVEAPDAEGSTSTRIDLTSGDELVASLIVGKPRVRPGRQGLFVRRADEDQVYLCEGRVSTPSTLTSWVDPEILSLENARLRDVRIQHKEGEEVFVSRGDEPTGVFELQNVPPARESAGKGPSIGSILNRLSLDDVRPAGEVDMTAAPRTETRFHCYDGLILTVSLAEFEDASWVTLSAAYEAPPEPTEEPAEEPEAETEGEEGEAAEEVEESEPAHDPEAVRAEVAELNARLGPWAFRIPTYKADLLASSLEDMLESLDDSPEPAPLAPGSDVEIPGHLQQLLQDEGFETAGVKTETPSVDISPLPPVDPDPVVEEPLVDPPPAEDPEADPPPASDSDGG